jgi:hypothetical protein
VVAVSLLGATVALTEDFSFLSDRFEWHDFATMAGPSGTKYSFCWTIHPCPEGQDCTAPYNIQFRKYRAEGGQQYMSNLLHVTEWKLNKTLADGSKEYCSNDETLPMSGHWVYEARLCGPNDVPGGEPICTIGTSVDPTYAVVDLADGTRTKRAWWIYTFLAPPGTPEVDMKWYNRPEPNDEPGVVPVLKQPKEVLANVADR